MECHCWLLEGEHHWMLEERRWLPEERRRPMEERRRPMEELRPLEERSFPRRSCCRRSRWLSVPRPPAAALVVGSAAAAAAAAAAAHAAAVQVSLSLLLRDGSRQPLPQGRREWCRPGRGGWAGGRSRRCRWRAPAAAAGPPLQIRSSSAHGSEEGWEGGVGPTGTRMLLRPSLAPIDGPPGQRIVRKCAGGAREVLLSRASTNRARHWQSTFPVHPG